MTILDLINKSAIMLNVQEILNDSNISTITDNNEEIVLNNNFALKRMYEFSKIVINEISSRIPKVVKEEHKSSDKMIDLNNLTRVAKILGVKDAFGYVNYTIIDKNINVKKDNTYTIIYYQYPKVDSILNEIDICDEVLNEDILINGLNSYYCLAMGLFSEYNVYKSNYEDRLNNLKNLKVFAMPCRSWE